MVSTSALNLLAYTLITSVSNSDEICSSYESGCCPGYEWNSELGNCTECNIGYSGPDCSKQCVYPSYGWKCTLECNCSKENCSFSTGCLVKSFLEKKVCCPVYQWKNEQENAQDVACLTVDNLVQTGCSTTAVTCVSSLPPMTSVLNSSVSNTLSAMDSTPTSMEVILPSSSTPDKSKPDVT